MGNARVLVRRSVFAVSVLALIALGAALIAPSVAFAALAQPSIGTVQTGSGWATVGWWAPGVPLSGWSSELQYSTDAGFTGATTVPVPGEPIEDYGEYTLSDMTNGTPYYFRVRSLDGLGGVSSWSDALSVTAYPPKPTSTWMFAGSPGTKLARMYWNSSSRAVRYQVQQATNSSFTTGLISIYDGPNRSATSSGLTSGKPYYFRTRCLDQWDRASAWSNTLKITPK